MSRRKIGLLIAGAVLALSALACKDTQSVTGCSEKGQYMNGAGQCVDRAYQGDPMGDLLGIASTFEKLQK